jgi:hypothetical protein
MPCAVADGGLLIGMSSRHIWECLYVCGVLMSNVRKKPVSLKVSPGYGAYPIVCVEVQ